jgi:cytochrome c
MKTIAYGVLLSGALAAAPALADPMEDLAKAKQCFDCHGMTTQLTAPSFKSMAQKYKGVKNADVKLAQLILRGESGHFGAISSSAEMPPGARVKLTADESKKLADWILAIK